MLPFDLHVLGLPPAFTLSQDQTLHLSFLGPKPQSFECKKSVQAYESLAAFLHELTCCSVTNVLQDGTTPPAGRPHKSPAHTVKDH